MTIKRYFILKGDNKTDKIMFIMPFSLRPPPKDISNFEFNNQFIPLPVEMRLVSDFKSGLKMITSDLKKIKNSFQFYGIYYCV